VTEQTQPTPAKAFTQLGNLIEVMHADMMEILRLIEKYPDLAQEISDHYPFDSSFDEVAVAVNEWAGRMREIGREREQHERESDDNGTADGEQQGTNHD